MNLEDAKKILEKYGKKKKKINIKKNNTNLKNTTIENYITKIKYIHYNICNKKINSFVINKKFYTRKYKSRNSGSPIGAFLF